MIFRSRLRLILAALVAITFTSLLAVEMFGDEVVSIVQESKASRVHEVYLAELASLDAEVPEDTDLPLRTFPQEQPKNLNHNYTKTVVAGKRQWEDVSWIERELLSYDRAVYDVDNGNAELHVPKNKGNEVMVYLTYIIDHYHVLNDISIFVHSDRWAWHNNDLLDNDLAMMLNNLVPQRVIREGYVNLKCQFYPGCPAWIDTSATTLNEEKREELLIPQVWKSLFPNDPLPTSLAQPCCSQFALSRSRIQAIPQEEYIRLRSWLLSTNIEDHLVGRIFEYIWQYLWTGHSTLCVNQHACYCDVFGACFEDEEDFQSWFELRYRVRKEEWEMVELETAIRGDDQLDGVPKHAQIKLQERKKELQLNVDRKWVKMLDKRRIALRNGRDPKRRAKIAQRAVDSGDSKT
jgi:hypothetical protein